MSTFHHMGITVSDIRVSYRFYSEVVGMREWDQSKELDVDMGNEPDPVDRQFIGVRSEAFNLLTNNDGAEIKYAHLQSIDGNLVLQLVEYIKGGGAALELDHHRIGSPHFSFFVDDVDTKWQEIQGRPDVQVTSEIIQIAPEMRSFYVTDPDGVPVEFLQVMR